MDAISLARCWTFYKWYVHVSFPCSSSGNAGMSSCRQCHRDFFPWDLEEGWCCRCWCLWITRQENRIVTRFQEARPIIASLRAIPETPVWRSCPPAQQVSDSESDSTESLTNSSAAQPVAHHAGAAAGEKVTARAGAMARPALRARTVWAIFWDRGQRGERQQLAIRFQKYGDAAELATLLQWSPPGSSRADHFWAERIILFRKPSGVLRRFQQGFKEDLMHWRLFQKRSCGKSNGVQPHNTAAVGDKTTERARSMARPALRARIAWALFWDQGKRGERHRLPIRFQKYGDAVQYATQFAPLQWSPSRSLRSAFWAERIILFRKPSGVLRRFQKGFQKGFQQGLSDCCGCGKSGAVQPDNTVPRH